MSWLSDKLKEGLAEANVFDGGKTAATVRASRNAVPAAVTQKIKTAKYGVLAGNPQRQNELLGSVRPTQFDPIKAAPSVLKNRATGLGLGAVRSGVGTAQGLSGLYDLATPGTGTSRVSKSLDRSAKFVDQTAQNEQVGNIYKVGQAGTDLLSFAAPSAALKLASKVPAAAKVTAPISRGINRVDRGVNTAASRIATRNTAPARIAASAVRPATVGNVTNIAAGTGLDLGAEASKGRDISGKQVAISAGLNAGIGIGLPVAAQLGKEAGKVVKTGVNTALPTRPSKLNDGEVAALNAFSEQSRSGSIMDDNVYQRAVAAANKAGIDYRNPRAVDSLTAAHLDYNTRIQQRNQALKKLSVQGEGGYVQLPGAPQRTLPQPVREAPIEQRVATAPIAPPPAKPPVQALAMPAGDMRRPPSGTVAVADMPSPQKTSRFAGKTIPESDVVSEGVKQRLDAPEYSVQTERATYTNSAKNLELKGEDRFTDDAHIAIDKKPGTISRQEAADAQTAATLLDLKQDPASLQRASEIYEKLSEHYTAAGQLVQAAAIFARRTPQGMMFNAERTLKKAGVTVTPQIRTELRTLVEAFAKSTDKDRAAHGVAQYVNSKIPSSVSDKVINFWRAGLLTAPTTSAGNLLGNTGEAIVRKGFVNPVATAADKLISLKTGKRTMTLGKAGEGAKGLKEGVGTLPEYLKTGYDPRNPSAKYDNKSELNYGDGKLGKAFNTYVNGVYRLMGTADAPFNTLAQKEALSSIAKAEAINNGLRGQAASNYVDNFIKNPPESALARSQKEADYATFKNKTALGQAASGLKRPLGAAGDFVVPFTQVPAAIATRLVERTPIGVAKEIVSQIKAVKAGEAFDQRAMSQAIGNGTFGIAAIGAGLSLAKSGLMTFGYPTDSQERKLWESEGKQPYSVRVGDRWYSLNYMQPFGMLMAIGGNIHESEKAGKGGSEVVAGALATAGQAIQQQSFLQGVSGIIDAINNPEGTGQKLVENTASSIVPNVIRSAARAADSIQRRPEGVVEGIKSGVPGLRGDTTPKTDVFGQPLPAKDNFANQYINPLKPSIARDGDPLVAELRRLKDVDMGAIPSQIKADTFGKDTKLEKPQLKELQDKVGQSVQEAWSGFTTSDAYKALDDEKRKKALSSLSSDVLAVEKRKYAAANNLGEYAQDYNGKASKLTQRQAALMSGSAKLNNYAVNGGSATGLPKNYDKLSDNVKKFYDEKLGIEDTDKWGSEQSSGSSKELVATAKGIVPKGYPDLPDNNSVADLYAKFKSEEEAKGWKGTLLNTQKLKFLREAYKTQLDPAEKEWYSASNSDLYAAADSGELTKETMDKLVSIDDTIAKLRGTAQLSTKLRKAMGYSAAPKETGSKYAAAGRKSTYDTSLFGSSSGANTNKLLRQLVANASKW